MTCYRVYFIGPDGHFKSATELDCIDDDAAIKDAKRLVNGTDVEVWQSDRKVAAFEHKPPSASNNWITHEIHDGQMIPKPADWR